MPPPSKREAIRPPPRGGCRRRRLGEFLKIREHQSRAQDHHKADDAHRQVDIILPGAAQHLQAGAAITAAVAAALHGHGQLIGAAEGRDEQRDEHRHQRLDPVQHLAGVQLGTAGFLGIHDLVGLLDQGGDEPQGNAHHHGQLVHREVQPAQRLEQLLDGIRQHNGAGGIGQQAGARDQCHHAHRHQDGIAQALGVDVQHPEVHQRLALARNKEEVEHRGKEDDGQNGLQALGDELEGDLRHAVHGHKEHKGQRQAQRVGRGKQQDDVDDGQHQLHAGVELMHKAVAREVLADGDISQHVAAPPFFASTRGSTRLSPASRRFLASKIILTA